MITTFRPARTLAALVVSAAVLSTAACGGVDQNKLQQQGTELQQQGAQVQKAAAKIQADIASGKITAAEGARELDKQTAALEGAANKTASDAIDAVKGQAGLPAEARKQLEDAQKQFDTP